MAETFAQQRDRILQTAKEAEAKLPLRNDECRSRFWFQNGPTEYVYLFFHGFTAAPYQSEVMGKELSKAGYTVLSPLMPGHGVAGDWDLDTLPPLPEDASVYQNFGIQWLEEAKKLGKKVIIGGLSGGGTLSAWLALNHSQDIDRVILYAAYLSSSSKVIDLFIKGGKGGYSWDQRIKKYRPGYDFFAIPALATLLKMGAEVLKQDAKGPCAPIFVISSESDRAVGNDDHRRLFEDVNRYQPLAWYLIFDRVHDIPHTMMVPSEGMEQAFLLTRLTRAFAESSVTWEEVRAIAQKLDRDTTFGQAVEQLNFQSKVSGDMNAAMTMFDKRTLVAEADDDD
ncbi:MAG: alpha/beta fold hydrolase [Cyanobacteria bacterium P01_D01_bin.73]